MKRLMSLVLCLLMIMSMFLVGCGKVEDDPTDVVEEEEVRNAITLKFYIITEDVTTSDAKEAMQDAFNTVCRKKYSTQVEFVFCTADEYKATLDKALESASSTLEVEDAKLPSDIYSGYVLETELDEFNLPNLIYPDALDNQIDIVLINSKEMLQEYIEKDYLLDLTTYIDGDNKAIKEYINTSLLTNTKIEGKWFAIPNNVVVGEYKYLLINKELAGNYYLVENDFTKLDSDGKTVVNYVTCLDFAKNIANDDSLTDVAPVYEKFDMPTTQFWSLDGSPFALATFYHHDTGYGDYIKLSTAYENETYIDYLKFVVEAENNGYFAKDPANTEIYGMRVVSDDYASRFTYDDDYYVIVVDNPRVYATDGFDAMFAVPKFTASASRSMEIIQDLMVDSELCNILLYGVEGSDYYLDEDEGTVTRSTATDYRMNIKYTGNVFMTYPCVNEGMLPNHWMYGMYQNQEASSAPIEGCTPEFLWDMVRTGIIDDQMLLMVKQELMDVTGLEIVYTTLGEYVTRLQQFYAGIDPNATPAPTKPGEPTTAALTVSAEIKNQVNELVYGVTNKEPDPENEGEYIITNKGGFRELATKIADQTIEAVMSKSEEYVSLISECKNSEEIDAAVETIMEDMSKSYLFYNTRLGEWSKTTITVTNLEGVEQEFTAPFGMMQLNYRNAPAKSALAGALLTWYRSIAE